MSTKKDTRLMMRTKKGHKAKDEDKNDTRLMIKTKTRLMMRTKTTTRG